ncbi:DUF547 domain-containing protein [Lacinutrix salivirga]
MKYVCVIVFTFLITSCCSTKQAVINGEKATASTEATTVEENVALEKNEEETIITQTVEVVDNNGNTIAEVDKVDEAEDILKESKQDSIPYKSLKKLDFDHSKFDDLLKKYVSKEGAVNYKGIKTERSTLTNYIKSLGKNLPENHWSKEEKLAYWINAYNALTIDLILRNYPTKSIKDIKDPWEQRLWKLGDKWYNLDQIEHQIIRKMNEPRIHFALVCAAKSCPKLNNNAFTASNLDTELTRLTKEFLSDPTKNSISKNKLELSKIFKWFSKDFKTEGSVIDFINKYTDITISEDAKKSFKDYNWELNN